MGQSGSSSVPLQRLDPEGQPQQKDGPTWWCKLLAKGSGVAAGLAALIIGIINCFSFSAICIASAVLLMLVGFILITLEAPCCCPFLDFIQPLGRWSDNRPHIQKAIIYGLLAIIPIVLCFSLTKLLACAMVMATAAFYGLMALGRKAERDEMAVRARGKGDTEMNATLINNPENEPEK